MQEYFGTTLGSMQDLTENIGGIGAKIKTGLASGSNGDAENFTECFSSDIHALYYYIRYTYMYYYKLLQV